MPVKTITGSTAVYRVLLCAAKLYKAYNPEELLNQEK